MRPYVVERLAEIDQTELRPGPIQIKRAEPPLRYRYGLRVFGPGMDTQITLDCLEDVEIAELVLKKLRRMFQHPPEPKEGA